MSDPSDRANQREREAQDWGPGYSDGGQVYKSEAVQDRFATLARPYRGPSPAYRLRALADEIVTEAADGAANAEAMSRAYRDAADRLDNPLFVATADGGIARVGPRNGCETEAVQVGAETARDAAPAPAAIASAEAMARANAEAAEYVRAAEFNERKSLGLTREAADCANAARAFRRRAADCASRWTGS